MFQHTPHKLLRAFATCAMLFVVAFGFDVGSIPTAHATPCGDSVIDGDETCDDGNGGGGDGCDATCWVETGWTCSSPGSPCQSWCGDPSNTIVGSEVCDGANLNGQSCGSQGYSYSTTGLTCNGSWSGFGYGGCSNAVCNNNIIDPGETCDGSSLNGATCSSVTGGSQPYDTPGVSCNGDCASYSTMGCSAAVCGNGVGDAGENCDDGSDGGGDGCAAGCTGAESGWTCPASGACTLNCGNGTMDAGEACDDSNNTSGDGCAAGCGSVESGYSCGSPGACALLCGNGTLDGSETCDDGGTTDGNGCSSVCTVEPGYGCSGAPSSCAPVCGDGQLFGSEVFGTGNLNGKTFSKQGFLGGAPACRRHCHPFQSGSFA